MCCIERAMIDKSLSTIKNDFRKLIQKVRKAFVGIDDREVYEFLVDTLQCSIPKEHGVQEMFDYLSEKRFWRYDHYDLVDKLDEGVLQCRGKSIRADIDKYQDKLAGYLAATLIISSEFFRNSDLVNTTQSVTEYSHEHRKKLRMTLNLSRRKLTDGCLSYVANLWNIFSNEFELPSLTAIIDKIVEKCLEITWLVLPQDAEKISIRAKEHADFFRKHNIISLAIDNHNVYEEVTLKA